MKKVFSGIKISIAAVFSLGAVFLPPDTPSGRQLRFDLNKMWPNTPVDLNSLIELVFRTDLTVGDLAETFKSYGIPSERIEYFINARREFLSAYDYISAWRRGIVSESTLDKKLKNLKLKEDDLPTIKKVTEYFPAPADLIRFSVREVYDDAIRATYGLDDEFPPRFGMEAKRAGVPKKMAEDYWASHWDNPSILQGYEMLHREVISETDLDALFKIIDITPFWRDKLKQISYRVLTRVDVRRMYGMGVLDRGGVEKAYRDLGYDEKNAELMTEFTIRYENDTNAGISRSNVIGAYKDDLINEAELGKYLYDFGYTDEVINFWISQANYDKAMTAIKDLTKDLFDLYIKGGITIEQIRDRLNKSDLPAQYIERVINDILAKEAQHRKIPSKADLENWLTKNVIDVKYYASRMKLLGYSTEDIENYLTEIELELVEIKKKYLSITRYQDWLALDIIDDTEFRRIATEMKYSEDDIARLIHEVKEE